MNTSDCLSENRHHHGISGIRSGKLHVVSQLVWRNSLQHQLTGVSIFAFVAFQRDLQQPDANCDYHATEAMN